MCRSRVLDTAVIQSSVFTYQPALIATLAFADDIEFTWERLTRILHNLTKFRELTKPVIKRCKCNLQISPIPLAPPPFDYGRWAHEYDLFESYIERPF